MTASAVVVSFTEVPIDYFVIAAAVELGFTTSPIACASTADGELSWDGYRPDRIDALAKTVA